MSTFVLNGVTYAPVEAVPFAAAPPSVAVAAPAAGAPAPGECFNCRKPGHLARDCPLPQQPRAFVAGCSSCGQVGHGKPTCPKLRRERRGEICGLCTSVRRTLQRLEDNGNITADVREELRSEFAALLDALGHPFDHYKTERECICFTEHPYAKFATAKDYEAAEKKRARYEEEADKKKKRMEQTNK